MAKLLGINTILNSQKIKDITSAETRRMSEEEVLNLNNTLLTTVSHIFILDNFSGSSYDHLLSKKSIDFRIFGVPILEKMIENNDSVTITNYWKIFNNSFQGLVICTSNLNSGEKGKIENLVKAMDGRFTNTLSPEVTHLITNSTKTVKYSDAITLDIPIYHLEWVNHIWNKSLKQDNTLLKANAEQFDVFKLPPLFDLKITATGLSREKRKEISELIEENGGKFEEVFKPNDIDILIMEVADIENSKFKTACKFKIPVLSVDWINESIKAGYALSYNDFAFKRLKSENSSSSLSISETAGNVSTEEPKKDEEKEKNVEVPKPANILTDKTNNEEFLSTYTVKQAKKLGHIFDGYVFYFYNFPTESYFKVGKLISACGGIRITELDQSISHVLCYDKENLEDFHKKTIEKDFHGSVVDYKWLVECFKEEKLLSESDYLITLNSSLSRKIVPPSPLSRKAIQSLNVSIIKSNEE